MFFVVAFSSSLDVAAIQMELGRPLDYNHELKTVGFSNFISGITGGFTGSYIFSQTIFTMRAKVDSRFIGVIVVICSVITFLLPFSILAFLPKFMFGAILVFISFDLMSSWLYHSWKLVRHIEYFIIWATFIAINALNLEVSRPLVFCSHGLPV
jgi:SulP family sulfate permease